MRNGIVALSALLGLQACLAGPITDVDDVDPVHTEAVQQGAVHGAEQPLYYLSTRIWSVRSIPVCWTATGYDADKQIVRAAIDGSWQANLNLRFTGWGDCPVSGFSGIAVTPGSSNVVTGGLGQQPDGVSDVELDFGTSPQTTWSRCVNNSLNRDACIAATSIHEFGHAIGFAHEQRRPDNNGTCNIGTGSGTLGDTTHGPFDNVSIMNYCGDNTRPSQGDIAGSVSIYGLAPALIVVAVQA